MNAGGHPISQLMSSATVVPVPPLARNTRALPLMPELGSRESALPISSPAPYSGAAGPPRISAPPSTQGFAPPPASGPWARVSAPPSSRPAPSSKGSLLVAVPLVVLALGALGALGAYKAGYLHRPKVHAAP